jgi:hypothetical protein
VWCHRSIAVFEIRLIPPARDDDVRGLVSVAAHDAVVDSQGEPDGHQQNESKIDEDRTQIVPHCKTPCQEQGLGQSEARRCIRCRFKYGLIEIIRIVTIQAIDSAEDAARVQGHHDRRDHEGD